MAVENHLPKFIFFPSLAFSSLLAGEEACTKELDILSSMMEEISSSSNRVKELVSTREDYGTEMNIVFPFLHCIIDQA